MPYTVGTRPDQLNAANYDRLLAAPGMTPSTDIAALRARYPGLASIPDAQLANYASWQDYLGTGGDRNTRINQAWQQILKTNPEYAGAMPSSRGYDASGNVQWGGEGWHHDATGKLVQDPYWKRHPGITVGALTAGAAVTGGLATGAIGGGGGAAAGTTAGLGPATPANMAATQGVLAGSTVPASIAAPAATGGTAGALGTAARFMGTPYGRVAGNVGGAVISGYMAKRAQDAAMRRSPEELAAIAAGTKVAGSAASAADAAVGESKPYLRDAGNYYQTLLRGNRAAMSQAVAPARAALTDTYRGATRALEQSGVRGAARDVQAGELNRQRASQMAGLVTGVQPKAAEALGNLGVEGTRAAAPLYGTAGSIYGGILTGGAQNRQWATNQGTQAGQAWGGIFRDAVDAFNR